MPQSDAGKPNEQRPPTQAELDAMPPFERLKWATRHILTAPKDATTSPFKKSKPSKKTQK